MARVVIPGCPHHLTQRGNRGEDVFFTEADRLRYLKLLADYAAKHGVAVQAYCLMTNHVHLVAVPHEEGSLAAALKPVHMRYAQHVNWTRHISGRLWQGRFFSCPLDEQHLWAAVRYVERNPVRGGMVTSAEEYRWSSAAAHCGLCEDPVLSDPCELTGRLTPEQWRPWLRRPWEEGEQQMVARLRQCTRTGRPAGGQSFIDRLQSLVGRALRPQKGGRPRKHKPRRPTPQKRRKHG